MLFSGLTVAAALAPLAIASPIEKRQTALSADDIAVLQLAHYLENLEFNLYSIGCNKFTDAQYTAAGFMPGARKEVCEIALQEGVHRDTLASVLTAGGQTPLPPCIYSFPITDPVSFADTANMVTSVGIGAYLGGAALLTDNDMLLTAAGSILTTEARHDAYLRAGLAGSPFPAPFDTSLSALWAFNLAQSFVVSCPMQLPGTVMLPKLQVTSPAPQPHLQPVVVPGTTVEFKWDPSTFFVSVDPSTPLYIAFVTQTSMPVFEPVQKLNFAAGTGSAPTPSVATGGQLFVALTTFSGGLTLDQLTQYGTLAGPMEIILS